MTRRQSYAVQFGDEMSYLSYMVARYEPVGGRAVFGTRQYLNISVHKWRNVLRATRRSTSARRLGSHIARASLYGIGYRAAVSVALFSKARSRTTSVRR